MKKSMLFSLIVLTILGLTLISPAPVAAKAARTPVCVLQTNDKNIPGQEWVDSGNVYHVRNQTTFGKLEPLPNHPECDPTYSNGEIVMKVNFDLNLTTGEGATWGMATQTYTGVKGSFAGPFVGKIENFTMTGRSFEIGTGKLRGLFEAVTIQQTGENTYEVHGSVFGK